MRKNIRWRQNIIKHKGPGITDKRRKDKEVN